MTLNYLYIMFLIQIFRHTENLENLACSTPKR